MEAGRTPQLEEVEAAVLEVVVEVEIEVEVVIVVGVCGGGHTVRRTTSDCTRQHSPGPRAEVEVPPSLSSLLQSNNIRCQEITVSSRPA